MPEFDLSSFLNDTLAFTDVRSVKYPKGKTYSAPSLPHREKLELMRLAEMAREKGETSEEYLKAVGKFFVNAKGEPVSVLERLIGSKLYAQMVADGVPTPAMDAAQQIAIATYTRDADAALEWLAAETGKVLAAPTNREQRRAAAKKSTSSSRTAGSSTTRQPGNPGTARKSSATPARTAAKASTSGRATSAGRSKAS